MIYIYIFIGGGLGAVSRFLLGNTVNKYITHSFPLGTLSVNVLGSFIIGYLLTIGEGKEIALTHWRPLLVVGFLGGFTTFSAFSWETLVLFREGNYVQSLYYLLSNVLFSLLGVAAGFWLGRN